MERAGALCERWTVKDVVAHVVSYEELTPLGLVLRFAKGLVIRANEVGVREFAPLSADELVGFLREHLPSTRADLWLWRHDRARRWNDPPPRHQTGTRLSTHYPR